MPRSEDAGNGHADVRKGSNPGHGPRAKHLGILVPAIDLVRVTMDVQFGTDDVGISERIFGKRYKA